MVTAYLSLELPRGQPRADGSLARECVPSWLPVGVLRVMAGQEVLGVPAG